MEPDTEPLVEHSSQPKTWRSKFWNRATSALCFCGTAYHVEDLEDLRKITRSIIDDTNTLSERTIYKSVGAFLNQTGLINESLAVLEDELRCVICQEIAQETTLTECHHIFCEHCLNMSLLMDKCQCPLCRTSLPNHYHKTRLPEIDVIVKAVMLKHNPQYNSSMKQELLKRFCTYNTKYLQMLYKKTVQYVKNLRFFDGDQKSIEEATDLSKRILSLMKKLPCSEANKKKISKKIEELDNLAARVLQPLKSLGYGRLNYLWN